MICAIHFDDAGAILGWFIAMDTHDARRKATRIGAHGLAAWFYQHEFLRPGKYEVLGGFTVLADGSP